ncbi:MAG: SLBB domain-containing protein [Acidobacteriaceae bacterium]
MKEEATEFQQFVTSSVGRELPLFGYNLFEQVPSTFAPLDRVPVTADYVVGPGDELLIRAWGQIDLEARVTVDRSGIIYLPRIGSITVSGLQYRQLSDFLKSNIGRLFRNFDLTVSLGRLRSIQVFVVGQARRPGVYTISSLSTLVNTLFASGGPSNRGSMRHIQVKRNGQVVTDFDLYDLLLKGDKSKDVVLQPGDVIYIPPVGPQVAVFGSVNTPAIYELASTATLKTEIGTAGGLTNTADGSRVIVERIDARTVRKVVEFNLDEQGMSREVRDGDVIRVFPITPRFENAVTLRGNVAQPGRYPWRPGMRIRDLIPSREFLLTRNFWEQQNRLTLERRFGATEEDIARKARFKEQEPKSSQEALDAPKKGHQKSQIQDVEEELKTEELKNDVKRNAPEINWEYAVIQRLDPVSLNTTLIPFNLGQAILEESEAENKVLQPGDILTIFSQADIAVSIEKQSKFVRLEGEIKSPGIYKIQPGETLRDVVVRAGGLTQNAYLFGAEFTRESVRDDQQRTLDEIVRNLEQEMQRKTTATQARPEQQTNIAAQVQADQGFIDKMRALTPTGRVVLELKPTESNVADIPNLHLEDGDRFVVPHVPSTVTVMGAVYTQSSFIFEQRTPIKKYLDMAGNGTRAADSKHMFLVRADGSVVSRDQTSSKWTGGGFESIQALPGDLLVVPTQMDKGAFMRGLKDWSQVISNFGLGAAAIYVLTGR